MRRILLCTLALLLIGGVSRAKQPPNVLLIISDDQAWNDYGFMGHETIRTPHLDRLAEQSATFTRGYVTHSLCRPSLATIITGLYPHQHLISGNDPAPPEGVTRRQLASNAEYNANKDALIAHIDEVATLPRLLKRESYLSLQTGKWWEGHFSRGGFTKGMTHGDRSRGGRHGDEGLKIGREGLQPIYDFIEKTEDHPWFVWYAPFLPHTPHNPPQRLLDKYTAPGKSVHVARYQAMVEWFDETCGELLAYLDEHDLAKDTVVIYITDNGWIQQEDSRAYAPRSKRSQYDGGLRTPIMVRWPGQVEPKRDETTLVSSIDIAPTVLATAGLEPTDQMHGVDLLDVAETGETDRDAIFGAIYDHDVADIDRPAASLHYRWVISGWWKLIVPDDDSEPVELFDLEDDPWERENLAARHPDVVEQLTQKLNGWWQPGE